RGLNFTPTSAKTALVGAPVRPLAMTKLKNWEADLKVRTTQTSLRYPGNEVLALVDDLPIHNRRDDLPSEAPAIVRRVPGFRFRLRCIEGPLLLRIEDGDVRMRARRQAAPSRKTKNPGGIRRKQLDDPPQWQFEVLMQYGDRDGNRGLQSSDAEGGALELHFLFVEGVGRVIGCNRVDRSVDNTVDQRGPVGH